MHYLSYTDETLSDKRESGATSSFKATQPYVVIGTHEQDLILRKMYPSSLLSQKQYLVPKTKVFKVENSERNEKGTTSSDISCDSEYGVLLKQ